MLVALHRRVRHGNIGYDVLSTLKITPHHVKSSIIKSATVRGLFFQQKRKKSKIPRVGIGTVADEYAVESIARIFRKWRRYHGKERPRSPVPEIEGIKSPSKQILIINNSLVEEHTRVEELSKEITNIESRLGSKSPGRRSCRVRPKSSQ